MGTSQGSEVARVAPSRIMWMEGHAAKIAERRGEIRVAWRHVRAGYVPYIELTTREERRWQARRKRALWLGSAMVGLSGLGYLLWTVRYILLALAGVAFLAATWRFIRWLGGVGGSSRITVIQSVDIRTK